MTLKTLADPDVVGPMAALMRLLGDGTRIRILGLLQTSEMNVTTMCGELDLAQPTVSHHLGLLRRAGFLSKRREGKQVFYSLNDDQVTADENDGSLRLSQGQIRLALGSTENHRGP